MKPILLAINLAFAITVHAGALDLSWSTIDCGGALMTGGTFVVSASIGQPDAGGMSGGTFAVVGGFWAVGAASGTGVPAATVTAAASNKANAFAPGGFCKIALIPGVKSDPRQGGVTELRLTFDVPPGGPGANPVTIQQATCAAPAYAPYAGASTVSASAEVNTLVLTFTPGLENARKYKMTIGPDVTSIAGQFVEVRGLVGDVNSDGFVNSTDRSVLVGVWTGAGSFSCSTDVNSSGQTNATDRSIVVGAWTGGQNCAP